MGVNVLWLTLREHSRSEQNYAQVEKEVLSLVFRVKKFHQFIYGRPFVLVTDHKRINTDIDIGREEIRCSQSQLANPLWNIPHIPLDYVNPRIDTDIDIGREEMWCMHILLYTVIQ